MKLDIIVDEKTKQETGYTIKVETKEELRTIAIIRDMHFWGMEELKIQYDGRTSDDKNRTIQLVFRKKKFVKRPESFY